MSSYTVEQTTVNQLPQTLQNKQNVGDYSTNDNVDNKLKTNVINYTTNRILEIPQDIKLELNNGTLTLKAGSKVWAPDGLNEDGSKKFSSVITASDLIVPFNPYDVRTLVFYTIEEGKLQPLYEAQCYSGETEPTTSSAESRYYWFDTNSNLIKTKLGSETIWSGKFSFPVVAATSSVSNGYKSIDKIFNGVGYIGSTIFALPGIKCLIGNGRNPDGCCITKTEVSTRVSTFTVEVNLQKNKIVLYKGNVGVRGSLWFDEQTNMCFNNAVAIAAYQPTAILGTFSTETASPWNITEFNTIGVDSFVNSNASNFSKAGKSYLSSLNMPSSKYIDLTLGASGSTYTAPANGWFSINGIDNNVIGTYNIVLRGTTALSGRWFGVTTECNNKTAAWSACVLPCKKDDRVSLFYSSNVSTSSHIWRFYYAEGEI